MYYYSLTVRKTSYPVWITDYELYIRDYLTSNNNIVDIKLHYEDTAGLHFHAMIKSKKKVYINRIFPPESGWNIDLSRTRDVKLWEYYITKDSAKETNLINSEYERVREAEEYMNKSLSSMVEACQEDSESILSLPSVSSLPEDGEPPIWRTHNLFTGEEIPKV